MIVFILIDVCLNRGFTGPTTILLSMWAIILTISMFIDVNPLSINTTQIVFTSCIAFAIGGGIGHLTAQNIGTLCCGYIKRKYSIEVLSILLGVFCCIFLFIFVSSEFSSGVSDFFIQVRTKINYGEKNILLVIYGYLYFFLYPIVYLWAYWFYSFSGDKTRLGYKSTRRKFFFFIIIALIYAVISTAKIKVFLLVVPVFFIRSYFIKTSARHVVIISMCALFFFYFSMLTLNKLNSSYISPIDALFHGLMNYSVINLFAFDHIISGFLHINACDGDALCGLNNFVYIGGYKTNVYTIFYRLIELVGWLGTCMLFFVCGFIHNLLYKISKLHKDTVSILFCSIMYFPLMFQFFDELYISSNYIIYMAMFILSLVVISKVCLYKKDEREKYGR